jgi:AcrR family transcriptional regulator
VSQKTTRELIVEAADELFYQRGYGHTSFADIAAAVGISRGNFYHHFKSKDEILEAVIAHRVGKTTAMLDRWEREGKGPIERIRSFIDILVVNRAKIMKHGCPVGTLCAELAKLEHPAERDATHLFALFRAWLARQFVALGCGADADELALHLLSQSQGVATLANAFGDRSFVEREVTRMRQWLEQCAKGNRKR